MKSSHRTRVLAVMTSKGLRHRGFCTCGLMPFVLRRERAAADGDVAAHLADYYKTRAECRFKLLCHDLERRGLDATPTRLNLEIHGHSSRNLNGRESRWRREVFEELGYTHSGRYWERP